VRLRAFGRLEFGLGGRHDRALRRDDLSQISEPGLRAGARGAQGEDLAVLVTVESAMRQRVAGLLRRVLLALLDVRVQSPTMKSSRCSVSSDSSGSSWCEVSANLSETWFSSSAQAVRISAARTMSLTGSPPA
jgi:hypothetical protein